MFILFLLAPTIFASTTWAASALPVVVELEPNDAPQQAVSFSAPAMLSGTMVSANDQDAFLWRISDADALKPWTLTLEGLPDALTGVSLIAVTYGPDPNDSQAGTEVVTDTEKLLTFGIRDGSRPVTKPDLWLPAGDYLVGFFSAGQQGGYRPPTLGAAVDTMSAGAAPVDQAEVDALSSYRFRIEPGKAPGLRTVTPHVDQAQALSLRLPGGVAELAGGVTWYQFEVSEERSQSRWQVEGAIMLARNASIQLIDAAATVLAKAQTDGAGRYRLPNLTLAPGQYFLKLDDGEATPAVRSLSLRAVGEVVAGAEREPNDTRALANRITFAETLTGAIDKASEADYFEFALTDEEATQSLSIILESETLTSVQFCLLDFAGAGRLCRSGQPPIALSDLHLEPGTHGLSVARSQDLGAYRILHQSGEPPNAVAEREPNNLAKDATLLGRKRLLKGTIDEQDTDYFTLITTGEPQLWRLQVVGDGMHDLSYLPQNDMGSQRVRAKGGVRRLRLDNLFLLPGRHQFSLTGKQAGKYVLRAIPLGPPDTRLEREPNNSNGLAHPLALNHKAIGLLNESSDYDYFRFHIPAVQRVQLSLRIPADAGVSVSLYWDGGRVKEYALRSGESISERLRLEPGDYYLQLSPYTTSEAEYELVVEQISDLPASSDVEPNDSALTASAWPDNGLLNGSVGVSRAGADWYRLPAFEQPTTVLINGEKGPRFSVVDASRKKVTEAVPLETGGWRAEIPAQQETYLYVYGSSEYRWTVATEGSVVEPKEPLPLSLRLEAPKQGIAAFAQVAQRLPATLMLKNTALEPVSFDLQAATIDHKWQLALSETRTTIPANAEQQLPVDVLIAPDAWPDQPVTLSVVARAENRRPAQAKLALNAQRQTPPLNPQRQVLLPKALQGHVNVAAARFGATLVGKEEGNSSALTDGLLILGDYFLTKRIASTGPASIEPVIDLVGDEPVTVTGFSFHPFGLQDGQPAQRNARKVSVALSVDGQNFTTVLTTPLTAHTHEQAFALPQPQPARFAKLTLLDSTDVLISLGEWKVFADPQSVPSLKQPNIALPEVGGHIVSARPVWPNYSYDETMLTEKADAVSMRMQANVDAQWVLGFHHNRVARVGRILWRDAAEGNRFTSVALSSSLTSPQGPWTSLGTWDLSAEGNKQWLPSQPTWARFIRFDVADAAPRETIRVPDQISVIEAPDEHGSILGEWGHNTADGPYERTHPPVLVASAGEVPEHRMRNKALLLEPAQWRDGVVRLNDYDNWYRVSVPSGHNILNVTLRGHPTVRAQAALYNTAEEELELTQSGSEPGERLLTATVVPGDYWLKVSEPPRSVVFTWDTSGSTAAVRPIIAQAVLNYVKDVKPGSDEAHMLPFGGGFLSRQWLDQPYMLQSVLNDYNGAGDSSEAETALVQASTKLKDRQGQRIIVLITDAATNRDRNLWPTLDAVRPMIIAMGVSSRGAFGSKPPREQDLLEDWSMVGEGYYEYVENVGSVARAFDRASARIRGPAPYQVRMQTRFEAEPEPGWLLIKPAPADQPPSVELPKPTLEVVLDASGSMLQRLEGKRRYQIARETLNKLVQEQLPENTQFALRVFGHKEAGSCRTDLALPLAPLNRSATTSLLEKIVPQNLARTPIADSLKAAAADLSGVQGEKTVLLITDGEETCDGDAEAAITALRDAGLDTVVNIIGFAVDDEALQATFERWAIAGGGAYRSADSADSLSASVATLSSRKFDVYDSKGMFVGGGFTGDPPLTLPAGSYEVRFGERHRYPVQIPAGQTRTVLVR
ncbi:MAG: VWA domain-containing protein [Pseudomonadales bacterium]